MDTKLVWEEDPRREGMSRRGPFPKTSQNSGTGDFHTIQYSSDQSSKTEDGAETAIISQQSAFVHDCAAGSSNARGLLLPMHHLSPWQFELEEGEWRLLNNYIQRFSRTYPTCSDPRNPFLSVLIPLSMRNRVVLDSILALTSVQSWANGEFEMERHMLRLHRKAIQGSMRLVKQIINMPGIKEGNIVLSTLQNSISDVMLPISSTTSAIDDVLALLASCVLLLLYEKLSSGDPVAATPHLQLFVRLVPVRALLALIDRNPDGSDGIAMHPFDKEPWAEAFRFFSSLFVYNDLVRSTSSHLPTLSEFYLGEGVETATGSEREDFLYEHTFPNQELLERGPVKGRYSLPSIIARLSAGDYSVTDEDVASWNGRLDWFPSFALMQGAKPEGGVDPYERLPTADPNFVLNPAFHSLSNFIPLNGWRDEAIVRELYRIAVTVYRKQCALQRFIETERITTDYAWSVIDSDLNAEMGNLPFWAIELLQLLPPESLWENCLLWPIGVVAKVLVAQTERNYVIFKLTDLENRLQIRLYHVVRQQLLNIWAMRDEGVSCLDNRMPILCG